MSISGVITACSAIKARIYDAKQPAIGDRESDLIVHLAW
jgi:hypothetical protein